MFLATIYLFCSLILLNGRVPEPLQAAFSRILSVEQEVDFFFSLQIKPFSTTHSTAGNKEQMITISPSLLHCTGWQLYSDLVSFFFFFFCLFLFP